MSALARVRRSLALTTAALLLTLLGSATAPARADLPQAEPPGRVLVLRGGDAASDNAVLQAISGRGLEAVSGPLSSSFDGSDDALENVDVVVLLLNAAPADDPASKLTPRGVGALERFVNGGGALITGEFASFLAQQKGAAPGLATLLPAAHCGLNSAGATTYTRASPNAAVDAGLPATFEIPLASLPGSESCLAPKADATVLYSSSNAGGAERGAGLVAWNYGRGRVASFSTLLSATELQSAAYRTLLQNTVDWFMTTRDQTPPRVTALTVTGAGALVGQRQVQVTLAAGDQGGSGIGAYFVREYAFSGDFSGSWVRERSSAGWQPLPVGGTSFGWNLSARPGVHFIQAFVADRAGNISRSPALTFVNYNPPQASIAKDELHIYRMEPGAGLQTTVQMTALAGDPDLYIFERECVGDKCMVYLDESEIIGPLPTETFTTPEAGYQIEVEGKKAGTYSLLVTAALPAPPIGGDDDDDDDRGDSPDAGILRRPRVTITTVDPPQPADESGSLPSAPVGDTPSTLVDTLYLPLLRR